MELGVTIILVLGKGAGAAWGFLANPLIFLWKVCWSCHVIPIMETKSSVMFLERISFIKSLFT